MHQNDVRSRVEFMIFEGLYGLYRIENISSNIQNGYKNKENKK